MFLITILWGLYHKENNLIHLKTIHLKSFEGNARLCGSPLTKKCKNFEASPPSPLTPEEGQDSGSLLQFGWKIVPVEYGFGLVVGVTIGHVVSAKNRDWFIKYFRSRLFFLHYKKIVLRLRF